MIEHGTTAIHNMQTGIYTPTPIGENKPSEVDLHEHEEIVTWDSTKQDGEGGWGCPEAEPKLTQRDLDLMAIKACLKTALEKVSKL